MPTTRRIRFITEDSRPGCLWPMISSPSSPHSPGVPTTSPRGHFDLVVVDGPLIAPAFSSTPKSSPTPFFK